MATTGTDAQWQLSQRLHGEAKNSWVQKNQGPACRKRLPPATGQEAPLLLSALCGALRGESLPALPALA